MKKNNQQMIFVISIIHFLASFIYDRSFFNYSAFNKVAIIINVIFFIILNILWYKVIDICKNRAKYKNKLIIFGIYFLFMMFFLLLTFPGVWRSDDSGMVDYAKNFKLLGWQHIFSTIYYMLALKFIPIPAGIVVVQCALISAIIAYLIDDIRSTNNKLYYIVMLSPFLLLPVIDHNLYTLRLVLYSYIMLLTLYLTIKYYRNSTNLNLVNGVKLALLYFLLATWRTEGIYHLLLYIFIIIIFTKKKMLTKTFAILSTISIIVLVILTKELNIMYDGENKKYSLISIIDPITELVRECNKKRDIKNLDKVNEIINVNTLINSHERGIKLYYKNKILKEDFTDKEYNNLISTYKNLIIKYPYVFISERLMEYLRTNGLVPNEMNNTYDTTSKKIEYRLYGMHNYNKNGRFLIHLGLRRKILRILECRNINNYMITNKITYPIFWNTIPPTIVIIITATVLFIKKKWFEAIVTGSILLKTGIVFITAPDSFFMYYLPEYIIGYFILAYILQRNLIKNEKSLNH